MLSRKTHSPEIIYRHDYMLPLSALQHSFFISGA